MLLTVDDIKVILLTAVLPAAGTAAVLFWLSSWLKWRGFLPSLAIIAGFVVGNYYREAVDWQAGKGSWSELGRTLVIEGHSKVASWYLLPFLVGAALLAGSFGRWIGGVCQLVLGVMAGKMLLGDSIEGPFAFAFGAVAFLNWLMLNRLGRSSSPGWLPASGALAMFVATPVMLMAHSARFAEMATLLGSAYAGVAVVAVWRKRNALVTVPGISLGFPALMLLGFHGQSNELFAVGLLLSALVPSALGVLPRRPLLGIAVMSAVVGAAFVAWAVFG